MSKKQKHGKKHDHDHGQGKKATQSAGHGNGHDHAHDHDGAHDFDKDPAEQEQLARDLAAELGDIFVRFIHGEYDFAEVTFATYDVLQDLHVVQSGAYELVAGDDEDDDHGDGHDEADNDGYDEEAHTAEQEDLSGEPAR